MSIFKTKNNLRTGEAQIVRKFKNNETRPKFTGSYKKKACIFKTVIKLLNFEPFTIVKWWTAFGGVLYWFSIIPSNSIKESI